MRVANSLAKLEPRVGFVPLKTGRQYSTHRRPHDPGLFSWIFGDSVAEFLLTNDRDFPRIAEIEVLNLIDLGA